MYGYITMESRDQSQLPEWNHTRKKSEPSRRKTTKFSFHEAIRAWSTISTGSMCWSVLPFRCSAWLNIKCLNEYIHLFPFSSTVNERNQISLHWIVSFPFMNGTKNWSNTQCWAHKLSILEICRGSVALIMFKNAILMGCFTKIRRFIKMIH